MPRRNATVGNAHCVGQRIGNPRAIDLAFSRKELEWAREADVAGRLGWRLHAAAFWDSAALISSDSSAVGKRVTVAHAISLACAAV